MINLLPTPKKYEIDTDIVFSIKPVITGDDALWSDGIEVFKEAFFKINEIEIGDGIGGIEIKRDSSLSKEKYVIDCNESISVSASDKEGFLYALASLFQLINVKDGILTCPQLHVEDYPEKDFRGFMIDLGRLWHPFDKLLRFVDLCFIYKIKYLHLHFMDDNLYTLPSKLFPKLSTKGKSYTFDEIAYLNEYAQKRGIALIPEIEGPGHATPFNEAYPEIFANKIVGEVAEQGLTEFGAVIDDKSLFCPGSQKCMEAVDALIGEICEMFPDTPYIHIGGDEAKEDYWEKCIECQRYMRENDIADVHELYCDYIGRVSNMVLSRGKTPIVWEGFSKKGAERVPKETIVIAWESYYHTATDLLEEGFKVINCTWQPLYIVKSIEQRWDALDIMKWNVYNWQHWWENSEATLNPINVTPTEDVIGGLICSWELTYEQEINFVMENLIALSERTWNVKRKLNDREFIHIHRNLLDKAARLLLY